MNLAEFNENYRYKTDCSNFGRVEYWTVIEPDKDNIYYGDCEDYILTLIDKVDGFKDLEIWYCKIGKEGHYIGKTPNGSYIDCNTKRATSKRNLKKRGYNSFRKMTYIEVLWKKIVGKISYMLNCKNNNL
jgi:hypothetical protein